jgi:hypothetical protein
MAETGLDSNLWKDIPPNIVSYKHRIETIALRTNEAIALPPSQFHKRKK